MKAAATVADLVGNATSIILDDRGPEAVACSIGVGTITIVRNVARAVEAEGIGAISRALISATNDLGIPVVASDVATSSVSNALVNEEARLDLRSESDSVDVLSHVPRVVEHSLDGRGHFLDKAVHNVAISVVAAQSGTVA